MEKCYFRVLNPVACIRLRVWEFRLRNLCSLAVKIPGYRSRGPVSISGATRFSEMIVGLKRGSLSIVGTIVPTIVQLKEKVAAPV
jgi:hypothetical protein